MGVSMIWLACSGVHCGEELEVEQSGCQERRKLQHRANTEDIEGAERVEFVETEHGMSLQTSLSLNCAVDDVCAEKKLDPSNASLSILYYPCQIASREIVRCTCSFDVESPVDINGLSMVKMLKQPLRRPRETTER